MQSNKFNLSYLSGQSMTASFTGAAVPIDLYYGICIQAVWTGTPTGSLFIQISNDGTNWSTVPSSTQMLAGAAGNYAWDIDTNARFVQLAYTVSSSTGTLSASFSGKRYA